MEKLITTLTESVNLKLQEVQELTKMINLTVMQDVKAMRRFIYSHDTFERESFYSYLHHYDKEFFAKVYPHAHEDRQIGMYVLGVISYQFEEDKKQERKMGLDIGHCYPEDWCDETYPDIVEEANRLSSAFA